jgi:hypothetical protein
MISNIPTVSVPAELITEVFSCIKVNEYLLAMLSAVIILELKRRMLIMQTFGSIHFP